LGTVSFGQWPIKQPRTIFKRKQYQNIIWTNETPQNECVY